MGSGAGAAILSPITGYIISNFGWRAGYVFFALMIFALIPIVLPTLVLSPETKGLKRTGDAPDEAGKEAPQHGIGSKQALLSGIFWLAFAAMALNAGAAQSWNNSGASYLAGLNFDTIAAAGIISVTSVGLTLSRPIWGAVCDKWGARTGMMAGAFTLGLGYLLLVAASSVNGLAIVGAGVTGAGMAAGNVALPLITADLFGSRDYAVLVGYMQISTALGAMTIPLAVTMVFDAGGGFIPAFIGLSVLAAVCLTLIFIAFRVRDLRAKEKI
jgi:MFS family permease